MANELDYQDPIFEENITLTEKAAVSTSFSWQRFLFARRLLLIVVFLFFLFVGKTAHDLGATASHVKEYFQPAPRIEVKKEYAEPPKLLSFSEDFFITPNDVATFLVGVGMTVFSLTKGE